MLGLKGEESDSRFSAARSLNLLLAYSTGNNDYPHLGIHAASNTSVAAH